MTFVWIGNCYDSSNYVETTGGGEMCQMTCCIGLHQMKYVAVLAKEKRKIKGVGGALGRRLATSTLKPKARFLK